MLEGAPWEQVSPPPLFTTTLYLLPVPPIIQIQLKVIWQWSVGEAFHRSQLLGTE